MKKWLSIILLGTAVQLFAQPIDSLNTIVLKSKIDTAKIKAHYALAKIYTDKQDSANAVNNYWYGIKVSKASNKKYFESYGYNQLGYLYELMGENNTALQFYQRALIIAKPNDIYNTMATAYSNCAFIFINTQQLTKAATYFDSCIAVCKKGNLFLEEANAYNNQGLIYQDLGKKEKALQNYQTALSLYNKIGAERKKANTILNIGKIYVDQKNNDIALTYFNEAKAVATKTNNWNSLQLIENNIGVAHYNKKDYPKAIEQFEKAIELTSKTNNKKQQTEALTNIGSSYDLLGNQEKATIYYKKAEVQLLEANNYEGLITNYINQASYLSKQKQYSKSLEYSYKALAILSNNGAYNMYKHYVYENIAYAYKLQGNLDKAFEYQDSQIIAKEAVLNKDGNDKIIELQTKYETAEKQYKINLLGKADSIKALRINEQLFQLNSQKLSLAQQQLILTQQNLQLAEDSIQLFTKNELLSKKEVIEKQQQQQLTLLQKEKQIQALELKQKNNLAWGLGILLALLSIGGYLFYRYKQAKQKAILQQKLLEQEKQAAINILAAEEKERKRIATDLHDGVGQILTATWLNLQQINAQAQSSNAANKELVQKTLNLMDEGCKEVRAVSHNMMPNALLKKGLVDAVREFIQQINVKQTQINLQTQGLHKHLPSHIEAVLYRVIQESVNNVIKHAKATRLDISIAQDDVGDIDVLIEDNGKGFIVKEALQKEGIGLKNIKSRIEFLKGTVEWDSSVQAGTVVAIHIPKNNE